MFDALLRPLKEVVLSHVSRAIGPRVSAHAISCLALFVGLASAGAILNSRLGVAVALWVANRMLDGLDGTHARVHGRASSFGGYLDIVLDFIVYAAIPVALVAVSPTPARAVAGMVLLATFFVNAASWMYLAAILEQRREGAQSRGELTSITMPSGLVAGTETVVFYTLFLVWPARQIELFWLMSALVGINVILRLLWARRHLESPAG